MKIIVFDTDMEQITNVILNEHEMEMKSSINDFVQRFKKVKVPVMIECEFEKMEISKKSDEVDEFKILKFYDKKVDTMYIVNYGIDTNFM